MTQQPFSRPGAIDLSGFNRSSTAGAPPAPGAPGPGGAGTGPAAGGSSYSVQITEENFQSTVESSMTAPVLLAFYSPSRMPESAQLAQDLATLSGEFEGRFLAGLVDIDAVPSIAQAMQIPSIPLVVAVLDGRPAPLFQDALPIEELRAALTQVMQQLTANGVAGRHQPRSAAGPSGDDDGEEAGTDPRYAGAQEALGEGDVVGAVAEYQKLVDATPADTEAAAGLAMAKLLQRTQGVDLDEARA